MDVIQPQTTATTIKTVEPMSLAPQVTPPSHPTETKSENHLDEQATKAKVIPVLENSNKDDEDDDEDDEDDEDEDEDDDEDEDEDDEKSITKKSQDCNQVKVGENASSNVDSTTAVVTSETTTTSTNVESSTEATRSPQPSMDTS